MQNREKPQRSKSFFGAHLLTNLKTAPCLLSTCSFYKKKACFCLFELPKLINRHSKYWSIVHRASLFYVKQVQISCFLDNYYLQFFYSWVLFTLQKSVELKMQNQTSDKFFFILQNEKEPRKKRKSWIYLEISKCKENNQLIVSQSRS